MSRATPQMREFAGRLIACETAGSKSADAHAVAAFTVCAKLRPHLAALMSNTGFRALLARALSLASAEVPWMRAIHVAPDGSLEGLADLQAQVDPKAFRHDSILLLAQLLGLLAAFIGQDLTLRLVREVWPEATLNDTNFGKEDEHEKTK